MTDSRSDTRDGLALGLIGYVTVAAFYALFDGLASRGSLYTVNLLGLAAFRGVRDPAILQFPVPLDAAAIGLYNAVHLVASLLIGAIVVRLVSHAEREPSRASPVLACLIAGYVLTVLAVGFLSASIRVVLPWWSIAVANASAAAAGAWYLSRRRPGTIGRLVPILGG